MSEGTEQGREVNGNSAFFMVQCISEMYWVPYQDISRDLLVVLHSNGKLVLWNAQTCTPLWKKTYLPNLSSLSFDPFSSQNLIRKPLFYSLYTISKVIGTGQFLMVNDFSWNSEPSSPGRQMIVSDSCRLDSYSLTLLQKV